MATILLMFLIALGIAAVLGWTSDTRDSADWTETTSTPRDRLHC